MGLDIENDAGILKHYNVTNVEKSPCLIENTTSNSKIIIFQNKIAIITFCEMLDGEFAEWIEVMRYRHSYKTHQDHFDSFDYERIRSIKQEICKKQ